MYQMVLIDGKKCIVDARAFVYMRFLEGKVGKLITEKERLRAELAKYGPKMTPRLLKHRK